MVRRIRVGSMTLLAKNFMTRETNKNDEIKKRNIRKLEAVKKEKEEDSPQIFLHYLKRKFS